MDFDPEFKKLIDRSIQEAVKRHVKPSWFCLRTIWLGAMGSLLATVLVLGVTYISSKGSENGHSIKTADEGQK